MGNSISDAFESILPPEERAKHLVGQTLDGYQLTELLNGGEGGSGVVYAAHHSEMGEAVIKVLKVDKSKNPYAYKRFKREIKILVDMARADHVVDIRHAGEIDDMPWYAMEKVNGQTLDHWLKSHNGPVNMKEVRTILSGILTGLQRIQEENKRQLKAEKKKSKKTKQENTRPIRQTEGVLVHRDIKPSNIMIESDEESGDLNVMIIDFGISLFFNNQEYQENINTQTLREMTRQYVSPEMIMNSVTRRHLDGRSDQFQVGLLAYEMMTGSRYWKDWPNSNQNLIKTKPYPRWLKKCVRRSLSWDRDQRYSSHHEFNRRITSPFWSLLHPSTLRRHAALSTSCLLALILCALLSWNAYSMYWGQQNNLNHEPLNAMSVEAKQHYDKAKKSYEDGQGWFNDNEDDFIEALRELHKTDNDYSQLNDHGLQTDIDELRKKLKSELSEAQIEQAKKPKKP